MHHIVEVDLGGRKITLETGKMAKQAGGAVVVRSGDAVVLVSACMADQPKVGAGFFPLTVDYREYTYSAGKIPGGFIKREGRPSEKEVLTSRLIDRPIRPLFPEGFLYETQIIAMVLFGVGRQDHGDDLGFVQKALGEQRTDRTIDQAAGEDFLFRGTPLAFDESARNLTGGVGVLSIIDGEREEPGPHLRLVSHTSGDEYHCVTGTNDNSAARLLGHFTRFQGDLTAAQVYFNYVMHSFLNLQHSAGNQFR